MFHSSGRYGRKLPGRSPDESPVPQSELFTHARISIQLYNHWNLTGIALILQGYPHKANGGFVSLVASTTHMRNGWAIL